MSTYNYQARDAKGIAVKGVIEASGEQQAVALLRERKLFVLNIKEKIKGHSFSLKRLFSRVSFNEIVSFTRQFSAMVIAGLQIPQALTILQSQAKSPVFYRVLVDITSTISSGGSLGSALEKHPKHFSKAYISLVKAGEASGKLDTMLERLAENLEKDREFRSTVKGALIYPVIIVIAMIVVVAVLMVVVVPQVSSMYADFDMELPLMTRMLIDVSHFLAVFWWLIIIGVFVGFSLFRKFRQTSIGREMTDSVVFRLPVMGTLTKQIILVEFTRTLGLLIGAGIHLLDALTILTDSMSSVTYQKALREIGKKVEKGFPLGVSFAQYEVFPDILSQMVKVGEETGKLDDSLLRLSNYFENESNQTVKSLTTVIEPIIMVVLGVVVGFIVLAIITPIYQLTSSF